MSTPGARSFQRAARAAAADGERRRIVGKAIATWAGKVAGSKRDYIDFHWGRRALAARKAEAVGRLDELLIEFERAAGRRGTRVHWAEDAAGARAIVLEIARRHGARRAVKSKSMTSEEIGLDEFLAEHGIVPVESDLGEYIVQLRGEKPYHIVTPAMHLSREQIARDFSEKLGVPPELTAEELTLVARRELRHEYLSADMGITGANFLVADTGMVALTTNEGNGRLTTSLPRVHVAIAGIEKVIPRFEDLALFLPMLAVAGTGQQLTCYNTLLGGPRQPGEADGPDEFHVILLDNGRTRLLAAAEQREALHCIRCGACLNACPVFASIGGHAYGASTSGPIGAAILPHLGGADFGHLAFASSLCAACREACPAGIDLPRHLLRNRRHAVAAARGATLERLLFRLWAWAMLSPFRYRVASRLVRLGLRLLRRLGIEGSWLDPARRWTTSRALPAVQEPSFRDWWRHRGGGGQAA